jgi:hypothetical protein
MVAANMTRRRKTPIENDLQNSKHTDGLIPSNAPTHSSVHTTTNANRSSEKKAFDPMTRMLLDILAVIALRIAVKRQQQEQQDT